ncbi:hypothetical protein EYC84_003272 [Monilinia fructicola]|uniref:Uncharacterized protein n=1 Tax=Monilinia fructicola TaxID=38448 RepID=A0A5M9JT43_MONFR|nr:hypothetical protein EYC84_003272 [Monilinia fructicola]
MALRLVEMLPSQARKKKVIIRVSHPKSIYNKRVRQVPSVISSYSTSFLRHHNLFRTLARAQTITNDPASSGMRRMNKNDETTDPAPTKPNQTTSRCPKETPPWLPKPSPKKLERYHEIQHPVNVHV